MLSTADYIIIAAYLILTLLVGLKYSKNIKTAKDYILGGRNFATPVLVMTIAATWISGSWTISLTEQVFTTGYLHILPSIGICINLLITIYLLAPRMQKFLGMLSVSEIIGEIYGQKARRISGLCAYTLSFGFLAAQIKGLSMFFTYFYDAHILYTSIAIALLLTLYSALGGIRAVTFTDVFQFFTITVCLPMMAEIIFNNAGGFNKIFTSIASFQNKNALNPEIIQKFIIVTAVFTLPNMTPATMQRILMAKNVNQIKDSLHLTNLIWVCYIILISLIGLSIFSLNADIKPATAFIAAIDDYLWFGVKGVMICGVMAMAMSTADSHINAASVAMVHDLWKIHPKDQTGEKAKLAWLRATTFLTGIIAAATALYFTDFLELALFIPKFYIPIVSIPLLLAIMGFRTSPNTYIINAAVCFIAVIAWDWFANINVHSLIPSVFVSVIVMLSVHYLMGYPGGFIGNDNNPQLIAAKARRQKFSRG